MRKHRAKYMMKDGVVMQTDVWQNWVDWQNDMHDALHKPNRCQQAKRRLDLKIYWFKWFVLLIASLAIMMAFEKYVYADEGWYVQAGAYVHDSDFDEMEAHGNLDFPIVLELSGGYDWGDWFVRATHYSNPEAADTGLNLIGVGYRHTFGKNRDK